MDAVQQHRTHADQYAILDRGAMNDGRVPDGYFIANDRRMRVSHHVDHGQVLDIGALADADVINIASNDDVHPDRGLGADLDVADYLGAHVDVGRAFNLWHDALERAQHVRSS